MNDSDELKIRDNKTGNDTYLSQAVLLVSGAENIKSKAQKSTHKLDRVVFDKTGTLTAGNFGVTDIYPVENVKVVIY
ncbi:hypothetical protein ACFPRA_22385 [Sporosarcina soli]|uniref:Uncharacterized protein n=1 Tax=Sporosarcina soli TaxID=334736 RepID=A0ABW0TR21_9BACL